VRLEKSSLEINISQDMEFDHGGRSLLMVRTPTEACNETLKTRGQRAIKTGVRKTGVKTGVREQLVLILETIAL